MLENGTISTTQYTDVSLCSSLFHIVQTKHNKVITIVVRFIAPPRCVCQQFRKLESPYI